MERCLRVPVRNARQCSMKSDNQSLTERSKCILTGIAHQRLCSIVGDLVCNIIISKMTAFPWTQVLILVELLAGLSKSFIGYSENLRREKISTRLLATLLVIELLANLAVGYLTSRRFWKCGIWTQNSFLMALVADILLWYWEGACTYFIITTSVRSDFKRGISMDSFWLTLKSSIVAVVIATPFGIAALRSLLKQPLAKCSSSSRVASIAILSCSIVLLILSYILFEEGHVCDLFIWILPIYCSLLSIGLGTWAAVEPERQVLVHGLLVLVPPIFTFLVVFTKSLILPGNPLSIEEDGANSDTCHDEGTKKTLLIRSAKLTRCILG